MHGHNITHKWYIIRKQQWLRKFLLSNITIPVLNANKLVSSVEAGGILAQHPSPSMYDRYMYLPYPLSY